MRRELDNDGIRAEAVGDRAVVIAEIRGYRIEQRDCADDSFRHVFFLHVKRGIVRREIELTSGEVPYHRFGFRNGYRGALHLEIKMARCASIRRLIFTVL